MGRNDVDSVDKIGPGPNGISLRESLCAGAYWSSAVSNCPTVIAAETDRDGKRRSWQLHAIETNADERNFV